jgi:hypothetical protein
MLWAAKTADMFRLQYIPITATLFQHQYGDQPFTEYS